MRMKKTSLLVTAAFAAAVAFASPASAATFFTGNGAAVVPTNSADTGYSGAFYDAQIPKGPFTDTIDFSTIGTHVFDVAINYIGSSKLISSFSATFDGNPFTLDSTSSAGALGTNYYFSYHDGNLAAGNHEIKITGVSGQYKGAYSGSLAAAALPEASTWAMAIFGLALTGGMLRSRRTRTNVAFA
jgi:hypothetical protein